MQRDIASRPVAILANNQGGIAWVGFRVVEERPIYEQHGIGVLFNRTTFTQVGKTRPSAVAVFNGSVELGEK